MTDHAASQDREVPEWLRPAVAEAVDALPAATIRTLAAGLPGGLTKVDAMRAAWKRTMKGFERMPAWLADSLRSCLPPAVVLRRLDPGTLPEILPSLRAAAGNPRVDVALWLDPRPEVQALAQAPTADGANPPHPPSRTAWVEFIEQAFLRSLGCSPQDFASWSAIPTSRPKAGADLEGSEREAARLQKHLADARQRHAQEKADLEKRTSAERDALQERIRQLERERDGLKQETSRLQLEFHRAVRTEADRSLDSRFHQWFRAADVEEVEFEAASGSLIDLLRHADHVLEKQAEADRRLGHRAALRRVLEQLRLRLDALDHATVEALHPLPALLRTRDRVADAIRLHEARLGESQRVVGLARELALAIQSATSISRLDELHRVIATLAAAKAVPAEAIPPLNEQVERCRALLTAPPGIRERVVSPKSPLPAELLGAGSDARVLIDAYNVIGEAGESLGLASSGPRLPESLKGLLSRLVEFAKTRPRLHLEAVVDSPESNTRQLAPNLRVTYSGGKGPDRADAVIEGRLIHLRNGQEPRPVVVVSNDAEVRRSSARLGFPTLHPRELALRLVGT